MKRKVGVLVHGYDVILPTNWVEVVWWDRYRRLGRLPQGAKVIFETNPQLVVFGTGASEKDGKIEAAIMRDYLLDYFLELAILPDFLGVNLEKLRERIRQISRLEIHSKNTIEEILYAAYLFKEAGVERIIMVSSPDHTPRCGKEAFLIFSREKDLNCYLGNFYTCPSLVPYGTSVEDVVIKESPLQ